MERADEGKGWSGGKREKKREKERKIGEKEIEDDCCPVNFPVLKSVTGIPCLGTHECHGLGTPVYVLQPVTCCVVAHHAGCPSVGTVRVEARLLIIMLLV